MKRPATAAITTLALLATLSCGGQTSAPPPPGGGCAAEPAKFPRTATTYLNQDDLPPLAELARYDIVVVDQEWQYREPGYLADLRKLSPDVCLLAHVNLVDMPRQLGTREYWPGRYRLWQFTTDRTTTFPARWLARTADGTTVSEWPDTTMTNLTNVAPTVNGTAFAQHAADWVVEEVLASGMWDGAFLDVWGDRVYSATADAWDIAGDGVDVPEDEIYGPGNPWDRGLTDVEQNIRSRAPDAILVGNGDRTLHSGLLNGRVWESFMDPQSDRSPDADFAGYVDTAASAAVHSPPVFLTINKHPDPAAGADAQAARFQLASTLMQNGYWAPMGADYDQPEYYPELDWTGPGGEPRGRDYLGHPVAANPTWAQLNAPYAGGVGTVAPQVFRRDFVGGVALVNTGVDAQTVPLAGTYRNLAGDLIDTLTVGGQDGAILVVD